MDEMKRFLVNTPEKVLKQIDDIVKGNRLRYGSRTHFVNRAIEDLLIKEYEK